MMVYYCQSLYASNNCFTILLKGKKTCINLSAPAVKQNHQREMVVIVAYNNYYYDYVQSIFKSNVLKLG